MCGQEQQNLFTSYQLLHCNWQSFFLRVTLLHQCSQYRCNHPDTLHRPDNPPYEVGNVWIREFIDQLDKLHDGALRTGLVSMEDLHEAYLKSRHSEQRPNRINMWYTFGFKSLKDVFNMPEERANLSIGSSWYVGWSNCHPGVLNDLRKLYGRPHFLPEDAELSNTDYVFLGYELGSYMHISMPKQMLCMTNRNPRNLEKLRIGYKPDGYHLEKPGRSFWHKLEVNVSGRYVSADVKHFENGPVVSASTSEWAIKKHLFKTKDTAAFINLARVLAHRCQQAGITEMACNIEATAGGKLDQFLKTMEENGVVLKEPARYFQPKPWDAERPDKPWEVLEDDLKLQNLQLKLVICVHSNIQTRISSQAFGHHQSVDSD
ncbi:39S ribosomal protein L18, mitochondrial [Eumeta japonica]|uniref:Large ribosomal subunit protein uL18m n=1 Tax=Eumeta variegata TaxID=151549 RepID=A0A4C1SMM7_EUMVA|nr:39S ribosomal protein L18, mitochondrial [Eumeta japonica]